MIYLQVLIIHTTVIILSCLGEDAKPMNVYKDDYRPALN